MSFKKRILEEFDFDDIGYKIGDYINGIGAHINNASEHIAGEKIIPTQLDRVLEDPQLQEKMDSLGAQDKYYEFLRKNNLELGGDALRKYQEMHPQEHKKLMDMYKLFKK